MPFALSDAQHQDPGGEFGVRRRRLQRVWGDGGERHREGIIRSEEMLQTPPESQEEANLRACIVELAALSEAAYDKEMDILNQFDAKGCAEVYVEEGDE